MDTWVVPVFCEVVNIHSACHVHDHVQSLIEGVVKVVPLFLTLLEGCVDDNLLNLSSVLVVDESQVEGEGSNLSKDLVGVSKTISDSQTFESLQET